VAQQGVGGGYIRRQVLAGWRSASQRVDAQSLAVPPSWAATREVEPDELCGSINKGYFGVQINVGLQVRLGRGARGAADDAAELAGGVDSPPVVDGGTSALDDPEAVASGAWGRPASSRLTK
jgi:hypothetical protein